jgi:hypothetical protein
MRTPVEQVSQSQEMAPTFPDVSRQLASAQDGIRYVILH